ncbi:response regulator [Paenibacillus sp.]|uniref:response regulator n=1 Tax=Paenibacillus sp. TaxID=58172 RepID=UPI002811AC8A|nr:response regulator [Paenibacillus sp.]
MLRLLIVDDEAILLDGLVELFQSLNTLELEVYRASSAMQALRTMEQDKIDIVLTDIRMPEMSGLELFDRIRVRWPRCKVVFLTGYDDFHYIQEVLRKGGVDYVLKMDGDDEIIRAVANAMEALHRDLEHERFIEEARRQIRAMLPVRQREYVHQLLLGEPATPERLRQRFEELEIPLSAHGSLFMVIGRVDRWTASTGSEPETEEAPQAKAVRPTDRALLSYAIRNIAQEFLPWDALLAVSLDDATLLWLIQPAVETGTPPGEPDASERQLQDALESTQRAAKQFLRLELSFVGSGRFEWVEIERVYDRLTRLRRRGAGIGEEISYLSGERCADGQAEDHAFDIRSRLKRFVFLETYLDNGQESEFMESLHDLMGAVDEGKTPLPLQYEVFQKLSSLFLSYLNRFEGESGGSDVALAFEPFEPLTRFDRHASWADAHHYFERLARELFLARKRRQDNRGLEIVETLNHYIEHHLAGDLSLGALARIVYLNPAYLSRLYKRVSGIGVSERVTEKRIHKAKELLRSTDLKIQDIATAVGLDSPSYFARLFKRLNNMSPQEYRESALSG